MMTARRLFVRACEYTRLWLHIYRAQIAQLSALWILASLDPQNGINTPLFIIVWSYTLLIIGKRVSVWFVPFYFGDKGVEGVWLRQVLEARCLFRGWFAVQDQD